MEFLRDVVITQSVNTKKGFESRFAWVLCDGLFGPVGLFGRRRVGRWTCMCWVGCSDFFGRVGLIGHGGRRWCGTPSASASATTSVG